MLACLCDCVCVRVRKKKWRNARCLMMNMITVKLLLNLIYFFFKHCSNSHQNINYINFHLISNLTLNCTYSWKKFDFNICLTCKFCRPYWSIYNEKWNYCNSNLIHSLFRYSQSHKNTYNLFRLLHMYHYSGMEYWHCEYWNYEDPKRSNNILNILNI